MTTKINPQELEWTEGNVKNFFGKELLMLDNGTLKLVKVAPSSHYPEHRHPDKTEYAYVLKGLPHFQIGADEFAASPDEFYVFPTGVRHAIRNKTEETCILLVGSIKNKHD